MYLSIYTHLYVRVFIYIYMYMHMQYVIQDCMWSRKSTPGFSLARQGIAREWRVTSTVIKQCVPTAKLSKTPQIAMPALNKQQHEAATADTEVLDIGDKGLGPSLGCRVNIRSPSVWWTKRRCQRPQTRKPRARSDMKLKCVVHTAWLASCRVVTGSDTSKTAPEQPKPRKW